MGNRKQPFGYRMTLGEITILPEEAELVRLMSCRLVRLNAIFVLILERSFGTFT